MPAVAPTVPARPVLTAGSRELTVSWQAVELAASYEVWFGTSDDSAQAQKYSGDITGGITEMIITGLTNEQTYYVWIRAKNIVSASGFSQPASAKPSAFAALPETPVSPSIISGSGELTVNWAEAEGAVSYELWTGVTNNPASAEKHGMDISGASVTLGNLTNETTYYIWIRAKNAVGESSFSPVASGTPSAFAVNPAAPLSAPTVIAGSGQLTVSWQTAEGAVVYEVWAGTTNNPDTAVKRGNDVSSLSAVISGLTNGATYYVWIRAKNNFGTSGFSPVASGTPQVYLEPLQTPSAPVVSIGNGQITVTWAAVQGAAAYEIWLATESATALQYGTDIGESLSATIDGLNNGTTYYVWLKAKNDYSISGFSPSASGRPIADAAAPVLTAGNAQISVSWAAIAGADQYEVFCGTGINPPQTPAQTINAPTASATVTGLVNGTSYNVWIRGKNSTGTGAISGPANAKPIGNMGLVTVSAGNGRLSLSWSAVAGADQYEVYYGIGSAATLAVTTAETTAVITGLLNGTTYHVRLRAKNANGVSNYGPSVSQASNIGPGLYRGDVKIGDYNLSAALSYISSNAVTGDDFYIVLGADESISPATLDYSGKTVGVSLMGMGGERTISLSSNGSMFTVNAGVTLTLDENVTLAGRSSNNRPLVSVYSGATLIMNAGAKISGNTSTLGGGIYVYGGTVTMHGGEISGNGASCSYMDASRISGGSGGGIYSIGTVTMNGGTISGNTAGGGSGGGISGTVTMYGGTISGNTAGYGGAGGGISGTVTMHGGVISGNTTNNGSGGGISGTLKKLPGNGGQNSGVIYGSEETGVDANGEPLKNTAGNSIGHAVYYSTSQRRNTTAGQTDHIDTETGKGLSSSGSPPYGN